MNRITPRRDYWFVTGIIALSITLKICALIALYIHTEELRTPYKDRQGLATNSMVASRATNTIMGDTMASGHGISSTVTS